MPVIKGEAAIIKHNHSFGSVDSLLQRIHSFEDLLHRLSGESALDQGMEKIQAVVSNARVSEEENSRKSLPYAFQMPLHYPRYSKADYETMPEWKLDVLFQEYGLPVSGDLAYKRKYAIGAFLWPQ
eukprot:Gb_03563 [translate_table: standard]